MLSSKKKLFHWIKAVLFLAVVVGINLVLMHGLIPNTFARVSLHNLQTDDFDDVYVGTSKGQSAFDPEVLDGVSGTKSTNCCLATVFPLDILYIAKEAERTCKPERIIFEIDPSYLVQDDYSTIADPFFVNAYPLSILKPQLRLSKCGTSDFRFSLFPWESNRGNVVKFIEIWKSKNTDAYKSYSAAELGGGAFRQNGFFAHPVIEAVSGEEYHTDFNYEKIKMSYISRIIDLKKYCDSKEIELLMVELPWPEEGLKVYREDYEKGRIFMEKLTEFGNLDFIDLNQIDIGFNNSIENYTDYDGHFNCEGARRFSECFGNYLMSR